jgi:hypothetical protein
MGLVPAFLVSIKDLPAPAGVQPCVALSRGLDTAARTHNTALFLELTLLYFSAGQQVRVVVQTAVKDTIQGPDLDANTVLVDFKADNQVDGTPVPPVKAASPLTACIRVTYVDPQTSEVLEVVEPYVTQTTVP